MKVIIKHNETENTIQITTKKLKGETLKELIDKELKIEGEFKMFIETQELKDDEEIQLKKGVIVVIQKEIVQKLSHDLKPTQQKLQSFLENAPNQIVSSSKVKRDNFTTKFKEKYEQQKSIAFEKIGSQEEPQQEISIKQLETPQIVKSKVSNRNKSPEPKQTKSQLSQEKSFDNSVISKSRVSNSKVKQIEAPQQSKAQLKQNLSKSPEPQTSKQQFASSKQEQIQPDDKNNSKKLMDFFSDAPNKIIDSSQKKQQNFSQKLKEKLQKQKSNISQSDEQSEKQVVHTTPEIKSRRYKPQSNPNKPPLANHTLHTSKDVHTEKGFRVSKNNQSHSPEAIQRAQDLVRKLNSQRVELERRKQKELQSQEQAALKQNEFLNEKKHEDIEAKNEKRQRIMQKLEQDKQMKELQSKLNQDGNKLIKQIQEKMRQDDQNKKQKDDQFLITELEKRKTELAKKRELSQPIRLDQIKEHQKKHEEEIRQRMYEREKQKQDALHEHLQRVPKFPKSQAMMQFEEQEKLEKENKMKESEKKMLQRQRQQKYAELVKDMFPVQPPKSINIKEVEQSPKPMNRGNSKKKELVVPHLENKLTSRGLKKLERALNKNRQTKQNATAYNIEHSQVLDQPHDAVFFSNEDKATTPRSQPQHLQKVRPRPRMQSSYLAKVNQSVEIVPEQKPQPIKKDYLKEMRSQRGNGKQEEEWERIMKNETVPQQIRYQNVLTSVQKLEQKAKEKEKIAAFNKDINAEEEANNLYINSIKAKLALLDKQK